MRCTNCTQTLAPVVAWDIDGTISQYHQPLTIMACNYWNIPVPDQLWDGTGEMEEFIGLTKDQYREAKLAYRQGGFKRWSPPYKAALSTLVNTDRWAGHGVELWITTTRPYNRLDSVDPDTQFWLERMGVRYDHILYGENKYDDLANIIDPDRVIFVVDDLVEMHEQADFRFGAAAHLVARPHNAAVRQGIDFVQEEALEHMLRRAVRDWYQS